MQIYCELATARWVTYKIFTPHNIVLQGGWYFLFSAKEEVPQISNLHNVTHLLNGSTGD